MRYFLIFSIAILLLGCNSSERPNKPDDLLSTDKMSDIMYDVFLLNSAKGINRKVLENSGVLPQDYVFKKHNVDSLQFALSNNYYAYDAKTYEGIMEKVKQRIEADKAIVDSLVLKEKKVKDSLDKKVSDSIIKVRKNLKGSDTLNKKLKAISKDLK